MLPNLLPGAPFGITEMLEPHVASLEGLHESIAAEYEKQENGTFRLQVSLQDGWGLEDVKGLKDTMGSWKDRHTKTAKELEPFRDESGNLYDIADLLKSKEELGTLADAVPKDKVEVLVTQRVAEFKKKFETELAAEQSVTAGLQNQLHVAVVEQAALHAIAKAGASEQAELLLPSVMKRVRSEMVDGKPRAVVIGEGDTPRISLKTGSQELMTVDELLGEMKDQVAFAPAFPGSGNSGAGTTPTAGTRTQQNGSNVQLSEADALIPKKWRAAMEAAAKAGSEVVIQE